MLRVDDVRVAVCRQICATFFVLTLPLWFVFVYLLLIGQNNKPGFPWRNLLLWSEVLVSVMLTRPFQRLCPLRRRTVKILHVCGKCRPGLRSFIVFRRLSGYPPDLSRASHFSDFNVLQQRLAGFSEILRKFQMQILSLRAARLSSTLASSPRVSEAKWFCCYPQGPRGGCEVLRVLAGATSALSSALLRNIVSSFSNTKEIKLLLKVWRGGGVGVGGALAGVSISSGPPGGLQVNLPDSQTSPRAPGNLPILTGTVKTAPLSPLRLRVFKRVPRYRFLPVFHRTANALIVPPGTGFDRTTVMAP